MPATGWAAHQSRSIPAARIMWPFSRHAASYADDTLGMRTYSQRTGMTEDSQVSPHAATVAGVTSVRRGGRRPCGSPP